MKIPDGLDDCVGIFQEESGKLESGKEAKLSAGVSNVASNAGSKWFSCDDDDDDSVLLLLLFTVEKSANAASNVGVASKSLKALSFDWL